MKEMNVVDEYGNSVSVDMETKSIFTYSNKESRVTYVAEVIENGKKEFGNVTRFCVSGKVDDVESRLNTWNNIPRLIYDEWTLKYKHDDLYWNALVKYIKENQSKYFDEYGDWKEKYIVNDQDAMDVIMGIQKKIGELE